MASAGSDFDFWTTLVNRFASDGLEEVWSADMGEPFKGAPATYN